MFGVLIMINMLTYQSIHNQPRKHNIRLASGPAHRPRISRRLMKLFAAILFVALYMSGMLLLHSSASVEGVAPPSANEYFISVEPGDTLWSIAKQVKTKEQDIRKIVYGLKVRNQLSSPDLLPGQTLIIPSNL
ncbi:LysM peptidoglycan-binding domain-containing protein [Paenibacillaceae bacterium]|nr:LysM peptidoglycan-binding domain-containing protein [Paenibacillaceae bacterium]